MSASPLSVANEQNFWTLWKRVIWIATYPFASPPGFVLSAESNLTSVGLDFTLKCPEKCILFAAALKSKFRAFFFRKKVLKRPQIHLNGNLWLMLTPHSFYPQCTAVFFTAAQNWDGHVSNRLDIDLKAFTDTTLSVLQCCWAVDSEMDTIFFSCQVWQKVFMLPP